jgi:hypothetical protein
VQSLVFHRDGMVSFPGMCVLELLQGRQTTPLFLSNIIVYFEPHKFRYLIDYLQW